MITNPALLSGAAFVVKITLVFLLGASFAALLRNRSAAARHFAWALTLGGALALALLVPVAPRLEMPVMTVMTEEEAAAVPLPGASALERDVPAAAAWRICSPCSRTRRRGRRGGVRTLPRGPPP